MHCHCYGRLWIVKDKVMNNYVRENATITDFITKMRYKYDSWHFDNIE